MITFEKVYNSTEMKTLGRTLKDSREMIPLTLRQVEEATGISNAYLSQLENDKIKSPSANILYRLASIYNIELDSLLVASGIIEKQSPKKSKLLNKIALSAKELTQDEEQALLEYLRFLRHKKNG
jgi:HTH-type transcriptional regulator, competence development regulator